MRAPDFWSSGKGGALAALLAPLGFFYGRAVEFRRAMAPSWRAPVPVICIGNLVAGGAGKTPVALAVMERLKEKEVRAHFLSRGYGGSAGGTVLVDVGSHGAGDVGDEALLLARAAPAWVSPDRVAGCRAAVEAGAEAIVMDDGFQNPSLEKDLSVLVIDGGYGFGNGLVMPAGPLRERVSDGLRRADAVVLIGPDRARALERVARWGDVPILRAAIKPGVEAEGLKGKPVFAFAGIGRPEKFFETLRDAGIDVVETKSFPDHHPFTKADMDAVMDRASNLGAAAATTAKDAERLTPEFRSKVEVITIGLHWRDGAAFDELLRRFHGD